MQSCGSGDAHGHGLAASTSWKRAGYRATPSRRASRISPSSRRRSQCLERTVSDLGVLVEKEHAAMCAADRTRSRHARSASDECRHAWTCDAAPRSGGPGDQRGVARQQTGDRMDRGDLERLAVRQLRQQTGKPLRQHRFADTGRTGQRQMVRTGGRHLDGVPGVDCPTTSARSASGSGSVVDAATLLCPTAPCPTTRHAAAPASVRPTPRHRRRGWLRGGCRREPRRPAILPAWRSAPRAARP